MITFCGGDYKKTAKTSKAQKINFLLPEEEGKTTSDRFQSNSFRTSHHFIPEEGAHTKFKSNCFPGIDTSQEKSESAEISDDNDSNH